MMYSTLAQAWVRKRVRVRDHRTRARSAVLGHYACADGYTSLTALSQTKRAHTDIQLKATAPALQPHPHIEPWHRLLTLIIPQPPSSALN